MNKGKRSIDLGPLPAQVEMYRKMQEAILDGSVDRQKRSSPPVRHLASRTGRKKRDITDEAANWNATIKVTLVGDMVSMQHFIALGSRL